MKSLKVKIALLFLSAVIFIAGMGTTVIHFCCDNCIHEFFVTIVPDKKEATEEDSSCCSKPVQEKNSCCSSSEDNSHNEGCCEFERQTITLDNFHSRILVNSPVTWIESPVFKNIDFTFFTDNTTGFTKDIEYPPKIISPRSYLSLIRILII